MEILKGRKLSYFGARRCSNPVPRVAAGDTMLLAMPRSDEPIRTMTLGTMRRRGVRALFVTCLACGSKTAVNVDAWPDDVPVSSFGRHGRCTRCGNLGATVIPNWIERGNSLPGTQR